MLAYLIGASQLSTPPSSFGGNFLSPTPPLGFFLPEILSVVLRVAGTAFQKAP